MVRIRIEDLREWIHEKKLLNLIINQEIIMRKS